MKTEKAHTVNEYKNGKSSQSVSMTEDNGEGPQSISMKTEHAQLVFMKILKIQSVKITRRPKHVESVNGIKREKAYTVSQCQDAGKVHTNNTMNTDITEGRPHKQQ